MSRTSSIMPWIIIVVLCCIYAASVTSLASSQSECTHHWDSSKSFEENYKCLVHRRTKRYAEAYTYGHPCHAYVRLNQPERRTTNRVDKLTGGALCDRTLKRRWYRFEGPAGGVMPTECVNEFHCGTHAPIWLNGAHPDLYGEVLDREACVSLNGNCCTRRWYIRVANCGDFYTYLLTDTPGCFMAYCAGSQKPCPVGQSSSTGYSPGCSADYPRLEGAAKLTQGIEGHKVAFYCDYDGFIPVGTILQVEWFVQGDHSGEADAGEFPVFQDSMTQRRRSVLEEGHWAGKMGSTISCRMRSKWANRTGVLSPAVNSNTFFAGIKVLQRVVEVSEASRESHIQLQATMPVVCLPQFGEACKVTLELAHDPDVGGKKCVDGKVRQVVFGDCSIDLTPANWNQVHNVSVKAVRDFYHDGNKRMRVGFKPVYSTLSSPAWNGYQLPEVEVVAQDAPNKLCTSTGDPHIMTFDGLYYHVYLQGEFVMYKNTQLPLQINTRLELCGKSVSCNCGVAVKAGDDVIVIDRCERRKRNLAFGQSFPEGWRSLHRHALEQGAEFVNGLKLYEHDEGRRYTIHLPTGAYVEFKVGENWVNVFLHASSDDWLVTRGLCGTFDGDKVNDLMHRDGVTIGKARDHAACGEDETVCAFAESWRVPKEKSFFGEVVEVELEDHKFATATQQYCKCEKVGDKTDVVCNYHYDVHNCESELDRRQGVERTHDVLVKAPTPAPAWGDWAALVARHESGSLPQQRRRRREAVVEGDGQRGEDQTKDLTDQTTDYFQSEFVYDETFRGSVPRFPTPSGLTEGRVRAHCIDALLAARVGRTCGAIVRPVLANLIDECVTDIKVADDLSWSAAALNTMTAECITNIHSDAKLWVEEPDKHHDTSNHDNQTVMAALPPTRALRLLRKVCPAGCSDRGVCLEGVCKCHLGYTGVDCATDSTQLPQLTRVSGSGLCDVRDRPCHWVTVFGTGFKNTTNTTCSYKLITGETLQTEAVFVTFEEMRCRLPPHNVTPQDPDVTSGVPHQAFLVSIIQDDHQTTDKAVVIFDSTCQSCIVLKTVYRCRQKRESCLVNGFCFSPGEQHPTDCCRTCDPSRGRDEFTQLRENRPPIIHPAQTSYISQQGDTWRLGVDAVDPDGCDVVYDVISLHQSHFSLSVTSSGVKAELPGTAPGMFAFNLTAQDGCGAGVTQTFTVTVMPTPAPTQAPAVTQGAAVNCTANRPPSFSASEVTYTAVLGELLRVAVNATDPDDDELEYYVIKDTKADVGINVRGVLRYMSPLVNTTEKMTILVLDACNQKAYQDVVVTSSPCGCLHQGACVPVVGMPRGQGHYRCLCREEYTGNWCQFRRSRVRAPSGKKWNNSNNGH